MLKIGLIFSLLCAPPPPPSIPDTSVLREIILVPIPSGSFQLGTADTSDPWFEMSRPVHTVKIDSFLLSTFEITQDQYQRVMGENPSLMKDDSTRPVDQVSWIDAVNFCNRLSRLAGFDPCYSPSSRNCDFNRNGFRLPTEAEWEYACRAGTSTRYNTGDSEQALSRAGWYIGNSRGTTHPIGLKVPNAWGLYDMHGNVWEWCNDYFIEYSKSEANNPTGPRYGDSKVLRGGGWHFPAAGCACAYRHRGQPSYKLSFVGFRVARRQMPPRPLPPRHRKRN